MVGMKEGKGEGGGGGGGSGVGGGGGGGGGSYSASSIASRALPPSRLMDRTDLSMISIRRIVLQDGDQNWIRLVHASALRTTLSIS
jgi:hypothetical protein